ncbi:hypothetical protein MTR72_13700 [Bradyrhizobium sp. ISRA442]|uniref:hypothetical protein n=1 Tax=Bradyrhizobium sp. ISRA442 TaxID=2866197 RepID=UPI00311AC95C
MEAENFLASGFGIRRSLEARAGWCPLSEQARVWQPSRLKGIQVGASFGTPFLGATQVFDLRPMPRKYLALERTDDSANRFVSSGTILLSCSGTVGRATVAHQAHEGVLISHDLLRVAPLREDWWGWIYAYLRAPKARAMMNAAQYGHIIKHLEVAHLNALPILQLALPVRERFEERVRRIVSDRRRSVQLTAEAESIYESAFPSLRPDEPDAAGFEVSALAMFGSRRRLDAARFVPSVERALEAFRRDAVDTVTVSELTRRVFVPGRFKHVYGEGGTPYLDSADVLEVSPDIKKFVLSLSEEEQEDYRVEPGWLLVPCSGQVYGNIGHSVLATEWHVGKVLTNHIMRICPSENVRSGYLLCALGHPKLGRPQLVRFAFGSSVPEISPEDVETAVVPRLAPRTEERIADLMEEAARARDEADRLEAAIAAEADGLIDRFLAGDQEGFEA